MAPSVSATPLSVVAARRGEVQQAEHGRSRESNLPRSVGTGWSGAVTCSDVGATHASGGAVGLIR